MISNILNQRSPTWLPGRRAGSGHAANLGGDFIQDGNFFFGQSDSGGGGAFHLCLHRVLMAANPAFNYFGSLPGRLDERLKLVPVSLAVGALFVVYFWAGGLLFHFLYPVNSLIGIYLYNSRKVYTCQEIGVPISKTGRPISLIS